MEAQARGRFVGHFGVCGLKRILPLLLQFPAVVQQDLAKALRTPE
jgi:hypothetical protein